MLSNFVKLLFTCNALLDGHYVEVYAGGAAIAWSLIFEEYAQHVHINDIDSAIYAFWTSVLHQTEDLCRLIRDTPLTIRQWRRQRTILSHPEAHPPLDLGFAAFFLNRTNRSGIIKGGVIGGKRQDGIWRLDARFNKRDLIARIIRIAGYASRISLYNLDASEFIERLLPTLPRKAFLYLDPPYYSKGKGLYEHHYTHRDHAGIAAMISQLHTHPWLVTYDSVSPVLRLYHGFRRIHYHIYYSAQDSYAGSEVMFLSPELRVPSVRHPAQIASTALRLPQVTRFVPTSTGK